MSQPRRAKADPSVAMNLYKDVLDSYMSRHGSRDLKKLSIEMGNDSWKSAPKVQVLIHYEDFFIDVFTRIAPTGMLCHTKLTSAILACHAEKACLFSVSVLKVEAAVMSQMIRISASKWRTVKAIWQDNTSIYKQAIINLGNNNFMV